MFGGATVRLVVLVCAVHWCHSATIPTLIASPSVLQQSADNVTVSWTNIDSPTIRDRIGIYYPPNSPNLIGWLNIKDAETWKQGHGEVSVPLVNVRANYVFKYFSFAEDIRGNGTVVVESNEVSFANVNEPTQAHLALTSNPSEMRLMWTTNSSSQIPTVQYGISYSNLNLTATGITIKYNSSLMCNAPATDPVNYRDPGYFHDVVMGNLRPSTLYHYRYGNELEGWSPIRYFTSSPGVGKDITVNVVCYGDLGVMPSFEIEQEVQPPSQQTTDRIADYVFDTFRPYLIIHVGDISYARGYAYLWELFANEIQDIASRAPYMVSIGNHEYDYPDQPWRPSWTNYEDDSGGECGVPYGYRYHMPSQDDATDPQGLAARNLWYSYDYGPVHIITVSTEHDFVVNSTQYNWVVNDLSNVNRSVTPWIVFMGHRPMYTSSETGNGTPMMLVFREIYEPLLVEYNVDICFWGHVHTYERSCPMIDGVCQNKAKSVDSMRNFYENPKGPVHVVIGNAGNDYQMPWRLNFKQGPEHRLLPPWCMFRTADYGHSRFTASSNSFHFEYVGNMEGTVHDEFWLVKN